jgi:tripartite-type tricarboxylate transporter receptor subunit TctC
MPKRRESPIFKLAAWVVVLLLVPLPLVFLGDWATFGNHSGDREETSTVSNRGDTLRILTPFKAGGTLDLTARALANTYYDLTGQAAVVENYPGGAGIPGTMKFLRQEDKLNVLALLPSGQLSLRPALQKVPYRFPDDFTAISALGDFQMVIVGQGGGSHENLKDLIEQFVRAGRPLLAGTGGVNTYGHLLAARIAQETGVELRHLPFQGNSGALTALLGAHADIAVINYSNVSGLLDSGKVKILGVPGGRRYANLPDIPTLVEQGIPVTGGATFALFASSETPPRRVHGLRQQFAEVLASADFQDFASRTGLYLTGQTPAEVMAEISDDVSAIETLMESLHDHE